MRLITTKNVGVRHGSLAALDDVDFHIDAGEIVTIVGPNGSGKSTLMRVLLGAIRPDSGSVTRKAGLKIGYVPQKLHIDQTLPISVRRFLDLPKRTSTKAAQKALSVAGADGLEKRQMSALSGGQFQRVLLARAILSKPDILILDEATQGLDQPGSAAFYQRIEDMRNQLGCAVLMVSHELHVVMSASDRVICLNGHVCCAGTPEVVSAAPAYRELFGTGTGGALALYRHDHDHSHGGDTQSHVHSATCGHSHDDPQIKEAQ